MHAPGEEGHRPRNGGRTRHPGDARGRGAVKSYPRPARRLLGVLALPLALGACGDREPAQVAAARPAYDADSAARGLLPPELADMLAVDSLLNAAWLARHEGRCRVDTLAQLGHLRRRIDAPLELGTSVTVFTRTTREGELRRVEILRTAAGRAPVAAASWDAATSRSVLTEWPQRAPGPIRKTTIADPDAPLPRSLRYVGRLANAVECGGQQPRDEG